MTEKITQTCIICPMGCNMEVTLDREKGIVENVLDNGCPRGAKYAEKELLNPTRTLTTTIKVLQGNLAVVPVKSKDELPKDKLLQYMEVIRIQQNPGERLEYVLSGESGPDHNKTFITEVHLNSNVIGVGRGRSKKESEQQAAREALKLMGYE